MVEGVSFLLLLGVAMPLKYMAGMPMAVKVVGWIHGVLFVAFCYALMRAKMAHDWGVKETAIPFIASLACGPGESIASRQDGRERDERMRLLVGVTRHGRGRTPSGACR